MTPRTGATTKTRTRKAKAVAKDEAPQERKALTRLGAPSVPWVDEYLADLWKSLAHAAAPEPRGWLDPRWHEDALAALNSAVDDALAEHKARAVEYDRQERALRGWRVRHARPAKHVPVAVVTKSGAFYRLNSRGEMEATPMSDKAEKAMAALKAAYDEEDGISPDVPGPGKGATPPEAPRTEDPPTGAPGPGTPPDDPALDEARDERA